MVLFSSSLGDLGLLASVAQTHFLRLLKGARWTSLRRHQTAACASRAISTKASISALVKSSPPCCLLRAAAAGFGLAGQHALLVAVAEDVVEDGFDVLDLGSTLREVAAVEGVGADALEEEVAACASRPAGAGAPAAAKRRQDPADVRGDQLVDQRQAVALVLAEREQGGDLVRVGRLLAVLVDRAARRQLLALAQRTAARGPSRRCSSPSRRRSGSRSHPASGTPTSAGWCRASGTSRRTARPPPAPRCSRCRRCSPSSPRR